MMPQTVQTVQTAQTHTPVLAAEAVAALQVAADGFYVDATYGRGGHSRAILQHLGESGAVLALDRDPEAVADARGLAAQDPRLAPAHSRFSGLEKEVAAQGRSGQVQGVLFDLGLSSPQLESAARGFSFMRDGPLDMRMDPAAGESAADWLGRANEGEIAEVLRRYGEERHARRIARHIVAARQRQPVATTARLAEIVAAAHPAWSRARHPARHPATRAFQAIRIHINDELEELQQGLEQALGVMAGGARLVVIAFHSLEDRIVKRFIAAASSGDGYPRRLPLPQSMLPQPKLKRLGGARRPDAAETRRNPRARSAVMRVAEKL